MKEQISIIIKSIISDFPENEIDNILPICKLTTIKPNENFISEGQTPRKFGFIVNGLIRYLYTDKAGREFTKAFLGKNTIISSYTAMKNEIISPFSIQALVDTEIISVDYKQWKAISDKNEIWNKFLIALLEKGYAIKEKRERELLLLDAENRYRIFRDDFHMVETDIKQHLIASYIGITPIALSRIRKKMGLINLC